MQCSTKERDRRDIELLAALPQKFHLEVSLPFPIHWSEPVIWSQSNSKEAGNTGVHMEYLVSTECPCYVCIMKNKAKGWETSALNWQ